MSTEDIKKLDEARKRKGGILGQMANDRDAMRRSGPVTPKPIAPKRGAPKPEPKPPAPSTGRTHGKFIPGGPARTVKDWYKLLK